MIKKIKSLLKKAFIKPQKVECAIDDQIVDCEGEAFKQDALNYYTGVPAPAYLKDDEWFGPAPEYTEKQKDYMVQETEIKRQEFERSFSIEPENIHQVMYEMATKSQSSSWQETLPGGSENFQSGPGVWASGR
jgi:hypothetical protein